MTTFVKITAENEELMHYGVLGMKWGKRTARAPLQISTTRKAVDDSKQHMKDVKKESGKKSAAYSKAKAEYKKARGDRNAKIRKKYEKMEDEADVKELLMWGSETRRAAATYMVDHNMSYEEATKKAHKEAVTYVAAAMAIYGGLSVASALNQ